MTITIEQLIDRDILVNASFMISELANSPDGPVSIDDLLECCMAPDWSEAPKGYDISIFDKDDHYGWQWVRYAPRSFSSLYETEREAIQAAWDDAGDEPDQIEALQHWIVTDWLAEKLEEVGALVAHDILGFAIWGRTECGQSLTMDSDLQKVIKLLEAL